VTSPATGHAYLDAARVPGRVIAFAHRGGAYHPEIEGLENTIAAFRHAVELGYRYLETDVHTTRDGVLLAFHDAVLDRVTDRVGAVAELTFAEVREARVGGREQVPTLPELLDAFPGARFNIDLKSDAAVEALADLVAARGEWDRLLVGSFSWPRLQRFRRLTGGRVPTSATPVEALAFVVLPSGRLADLVTRGRVAALQVPHRRTLRVAGRRITVPVVTAAVVRRAHAAGKHVHVWTIDDPEEMRELLALGVDGLFTDRTDLLREVLEEQGQWEGTP
jgi:glycerophosphoryl diester phosphodiesterase